MNIKDFLLSNIDYSNNSLRKFDILFAVIFSAISAYSFYKGYPAQFKIFAGLGAAFFCAACVFPRVTLPFYFVWMVLANILSFFSQRILFSLVFYLVFSPMAILFKIIGKRFFPWKFDKSEKSYWEMKDLSKYNPKHFEKQFS